ncbi:class I SAM-dependent methyltransferase [Adhaeribacter aquaticus]|uniref:class I SAM-dependent methyltransferase n=1 Tax=Adhaeribacter aquaticus TaxID=299567 RepID=UPI00146FB2B4|nr:class I SAM-dependent methyltransferase [Adhaeribacter aquaticus]
MMSYADFINKISFRFLQPQTKQPIGLGTLKRTLPKAGISLDVLNTVLPEQDAEMKDRLKEVCKVPRMSTFAVGAMINKAVSQLKPNEVFVNVGVWNGFTFLSGVAHNPDKICIGVDNFSQFGGPREAFLKRFNRLKSANHSFYDMDYQEYFARIHQTKIGFYIYDGGHSYQDQLKGLQVAEPYFTDNCLVLVDDTNWDDPRQATLDFMKNSKHEYKLLLDVKTFRNGHITYHNGVMIFQRVPLNS